VKHILKVANSRLKIYHFNESEYQQPQTITTIHYLSLNFTQDYSSELIKISLFEGQSRRLKQVFE